MKIEFKEKDSQDYIELNVRSYPDALNKLSKILSEKYSRNISTSEAEALVVQVDTRFDLTPLDVQSLSHLNVCPLLISAYVLPYEAVSGLDVLLQSTCSRCINFTPTLSDCSIWGSQPKIRPHNELAFYQLREGDVFIFKNGDTGRVVSTVGGKLSYEHFNLSKDGTSYEYLPFSHSVDRGYSLNLSEDIQYVRRKDSDGFYVDLAEVDSKGVLRIVNQTKPSKDISDLSVGDIVTCGDFAFNPHSVCRLRVTGVSVDESHGTATCLDHIKNLKLTLEPLRSNPTMLVLEQSNNLYGVFNLQSRHTLYNEDYYYEEELDDHE